MNDTARALRVLYGPARRQLDAPSRILAAQCYLRQGDYERCLSAVHEDSPQDELKAPREVSSSLCILRAKAYELIGNTQLAKKWYGTLITEKGKGGKKDDASAGSSPFSIELISHDVNSTNRNKTSTR